MSDDLIVSKLKTAIDSEEFCKSCPTAKRISSENLLGAMALGFSYGINTDRPQGEWIDKGNWMGIECSRCKCHSRYVTPFCPQCGARMNREDGEV